MQTVKAYYNEAGQLVTYPADLGAKQFYVDCFASVSPEDLAGAVPEAQTSLESATVIFTIESLVNGTWVDESGGGNSIFSTKD